MRTPDSPRHLDADLCIIGAGSAGLSAAAGAAMLGLDVVLYERGEMGGDCLNTGCVPSKALITAAKHAASARKASAFGIKTTAPQTDWDGVKAHIRKTIDTIAPVDSQERFEGLGVTVIREHAHFIDPETIGSTTTQTKARRIVIAAGSHAFIPPIEGLPETPYLTNETLFDMPEFPAHLLILGGGPIGIEMAQAFRRLGAEVTVIEMDKALSRADPDHAAIICETLKEDGVTLLENTKATHVSGTEGSITVTVEMDGTSRDISGSHLLVAAGRKTALDGLELEAGGVAYTRKGITVDDTLRSRSNKRVWALGDIAGMEQFTHVAGWHASVFVRRAFFKQGTKAHSLPLPAVTYTSPELAQIGLTEADARTKFGAEVKISSFSLSENDRAISEGSVVGEARLIIRKGRILGASIVGEGAGETLQIIALAMSNGLKVKDLTNFISPYPTRSEVVKRAASAHFTEALFSPMTKRIVGLLQRIG